MLTKEDLQEIGKILETERERIRKIIAASDENIKSFIAQNNNVLVTLFKVELAETNKRIGELTTVIKETAKQVRDHTEQIEELQEHAGLKLHKN